MVHFKHTVVLKKTFDVFKKTSDVFEKTLDVFEKTTVCFFSMFSTCFSMLFHLFFPSHRNSVFEKLSMEMLEEKKKKHYLYT